MEVARLLSFELDRAMPLQQQIHAQLVQWIGQGRLFPGLRLPSTRKLSEALGVSRNTVTAVIEQLKAEGFVECQVGRGSFIAQDLPVMGLNTSLLNANAESDLPQLSYIAEELTSVNVRQHNQVFPFTPGVPDLANFPHNIWQRLWRRHQDRTLLMGYDDDQGYLPLREALTQYLRVSRGVNCSPEQILITQGAQQAISLCAQLLLHAGDTVLHENPGYQGAKNAFLMSRAKMVTVPLKEQVLDVDWIIQQGKKTGNAKLMYTCPTHQYPMGGLLSASQRLALLNWSHANRVWIIEDDYDSEFYFSHKPIASMQGMTEKNNVIYMGSFSKTLFPGLRLGYLVLPKQLINYFTIAKSFTSGESALLPQAVIADFIEEGHFARHLRRMRQLYKNKWTHFEALIKEHLSGRVSIIAESAGMHLALEIQGVDDLELKAELERKGFGCSALSSYYQGSPEKIGLVLGFSNTAEEQRIELVNELKKLLKHD